MARIMLATDGSPSAEAAEREAIELAQRLELPLLVASVRHAMVPVYGYYGYAEIVEEMKKGEHERIGDLFEALEQRCKDAGIECAFLELDGPAGETLCETAAKSDVRLIVIGAHGWGRVGRLIHGSVSTYVLHHASVPVLVVQGAGVAAEKEKAPASTTAS